MLPAALRERSPDYRVEGLWRPNGKRVAVGLLAYTDNEETGSTMYCLPKSYLLNHLKLSS
jgi:hypothetical protein